MKKVVQLIIPAILLATSFASIGAVTDGLVSYWPLDVNDSATTPDAGFTNTLSVVGSPTVSTGQRSNAFTFNGSNTYLTNLHSGDNSATGLPIYRAGSYTIAMWVKGAAQTAKYLFSEGSTTSNNPLFILQTGNAAANNNKFDVIIRTDGNTTLINHVVSASVVFDNNWHHVAWVDNRGSAKLYVDGVADTANFNYSPGGTFTMNTTALGTLVRAAIATGNIFNGQIDEVMVWERALSQAEINDIRVNGIVTPITPGVPGLFAVPADAVKNYGDWHIFSVNAYANRPYNVFTYQWSSNGTPILDATNRTHQTPHLTTNDTGSFYSVAVSNALGGVVTSNATLTVLADGAPDLTNGLVNFWPLDDVTQSGTNFISPDLHFGHSMVLRGALDANTNLASGHYSNALAFNFVDNYCFRTNGFPIANNTNYTVSLWVKGIFNSQDDRRVFSEGSTLNNNPLFTLGTHPSAANGSARVFLRTDSAATLISGNSTRTVFDDSWHHLVWTDANGKGKLYVDGVLDETDFSYVRGTLNLNTTALGAVLRAAVTNFYFGNIDEVATWNRALSWTEIQQVMTNGVPVPEGVAPPTIATQPPDRTNNIYLGGDVTFNVVVSGTFPMNFQWYRNGSPVSGGVNPSALTDTLLLSNVQLADSNTTYFVTIANAAGSVTSSVVRLYVLPWSPVTNGLALALDIDANATTDVQPGFQRMTLTNNPAVLQNNVRVTIASVGSVPLAERHRPNSPTEAFVVDNPPYLTQASVYNDFIFANSPASTDTGISILIEHLATNTIYGVTIWSFDRVSGGPRVSDWTETSSGTPIALATDYTFDGRIAPTNDFEQTLGGLVTSSTNGTLQFQGVRKSTSVDGNTNASFGVFFNGLRLVAKPSPSDRITRTGITTNGTFEVTAVGEYPTQPIILEQSTNLASGTWVPAADLVALTTNGMVLKGEFLMNNSQLNNSQLFYRAVTPLP